MILPALIFASNAAFALLPPLAQSSREIQAIMASEEIYALLGAGDPVEQVLRVDGGYTISTSQKQVMVEVKYMKTGTIGPVQFELYFHLEE